VCRLNFTDKTFNFYIEKTLAGDFAVEIVRYIEQLKAEKQDAAEIAEHQAATIAQLKYLKALQDLLAINVTKLFEENAQLQADNLKLREALEACKYDCHTGEVIGIAAKALASTSGK
jgi:hypothetical protein